jgi:hypothetical protein
MPRIRRVIRHTINLPPMSQLKRSKKQLPTSDAPLTTQLDEHWKTIQSRPPTSQTDRPVTVRQQTPNSNSNTAHPPQNAGCARYAQVSHPSSAFPRTAVIRDDAGNSQQTIQALGTRMRMGKAGRKRPGQLSGLSRGDRAFQWGCSFVVVRLGLCVGRRVRDGQLLGEGALSAAEAEAEAQAGAEAQAEAEGCVTASWTDRHRAMLHFNCKGVPSSRIPPISDPSELPVEQHRVLAKHHVNQHLISKWAWASGIRSSLYSILRDAARRGGDA